MRSIAQTFLAPVNAATFSLSDPFNAANAPGAGTPSIYGGQPVMPQSLVHSWGVTIQHQLDQRTVLEVGYQGSNGVHDVIIESFNDAVPGPGPIQQRRPYPQWQSITYMIPRGTNNVQGLQARVERRPGSEGISALLSYSWIKTFDTVAGRASIPGESATVSRNVSARQDRGMGEGTIPYRVALTVGYELPFGPGRPLLSSGLAGKVIGGWSIQGITSIQGGPYVTAIMPSDTMGVGSTADFRPNAIQNPNLPSAQRTVQRWFNTTAFVAPPQYKYGNAGRSVVPARMPRSSGPSSLSARRLNAGTRWWRYLWRRCRTPPAG